MIPLFIVAGVIALPFAVALFVSKQYVIQRDIIVQQPVEVVFNYIRYLRNQENYSKWVMADPNMKKTFTGTDGTVGFIYGWDGNKEAGKGEQEIKEITLNRFVTCELRFLKPFKSVASASIHTDEVSPGSTKVTWMMSGESKYPMNLATLFLKGVLGKDLEISLEKLKHILGTNNQ